MAARSKGVIHWVSAAHALPVEIRLYDRLFSVPNPGAADDFLAVINPESLVIKQGTRSRARRRPKPVKLTSLSVKAISASTAAMQPQPIWCSTAPSGCVIHGRKRANNISFLSKRRSQRRFLFQNQLIKLFIFAMRINSVSAR